MKTVFLFGGQGSQYVQMGRRLFLFEAGFHYWMTELDRLHLKWTGRSVIPQIYAGARRETEDLDQLSVTHPAVFMVEFALARMLIEKGIQPDGIIGSSLGEFAAAAVAGRMSAEEALGAVVMQAESISELCVQGGMLAILHNPEIYHAAAFLHQNSVIAGVNTDNHFIVSGLHQDLVYIDQRLLSKGILCKRLPVRYPFHSSLIDEASALNIKYLRDRTWCKEVVPAVSCINRNAKVPTNAEHLWHAVRETMSFKAALQEIVFRLGEEPILYIDLTPSGTLAGFVKQVLAPKEVYSAVPIITMFHTELNNLEKLKKLRG